MQCHLYDNQITETSQHPFGECNWTAAVREPLMQWAGIHIQFGEVQRTLERIKRQQWTSLKKEVVVAIRGAVVYHTWKARNWKMFMGVNVHED